MLFRSPAWLNEGLAEWFEARCDGRRGLSYGEIAVLQTADARGMLPSIVDLSAPSFGRLSSEAAALAYLTSYALIDHVARQRGDDAVRELAHALVRSRDLERSLDRVARTSSLELEASLRLELGLGG